MGAERGQGIVGTAGNAGRERGGGWGEGGGEWKKGVGGGGSSGNGSEKALISLALEQLCPATATAVEPLASKTERQANLRRRRLKGGVRGRCQTGKPTPTLHDTGPHAEY